MSQIPKEQKALILEEKFAPFTLSTLPVPKPGKEEVLVKISSLALNPIDWKIQKYGWFIAKYPAVLGSDLAGDVIQLGEGVSGLAVGDQV